MNYGEEVHADFCTIKYVSDDGMAIISSIVDDYLYLALTSSIEDMFVA
jgi:hypothetical protein